MRTATIRQLRNDTNTLLGWIEKGEIVAITKRRKQVARLIPAEPDGGQAIAAPDFRARHNKSFPDDKLKKYNLAELLTEERDRY